MGRFLLSLLLVVVFLKEVSSRCIAADTKDSKKWPGFVTDVSITCFPVIENGEQLLKIQWKPPTGNENTTISGYQIVISDEMRPFLTCYYTEKNVQEYLLKWKTDSSKINIDLAVSARPTLVGLSTAMIRFKSC